MTWAELKKQADELGIRDDDIIYYYDEDTAGPTLLTFDKWDDRTWIITAAL